MRVIAFLCVASMSTMLAAGFVSATACGGGTSIGNDGGGGTKGSGGSKGTGGTKGSGGSTGGGGSAGSGGSQGTGGTTGSGGSMGSGGTMGSGEGGVSFEASTCSGGIACCPDMPCGAGDKCCANVTAADASAAFQCSTTCSSADTLGCTAASDCPGMDCCITAVFMGGGMVPGCLRTNIQSATSSCVAACAQDLKLSCTATDTLKLCSTKSDCNDMAYPDCCEVTVGAKTYAACLPTYAKLGGLTCM